MKKFLLLVFALSLILPVIGAENSENIQYMNQSESFSGFSKKLPNANEFREFDQPTRVTAPIKDAYESFLDEFDEDGFRKERKPVKTEKKVIKTMSDNNGKPKVQQDTDYRPMTHINFPKTLENADYGNMFMMPTTIPGMF